MYEQMIRSEKSVTTQNELEKKIGIRLISCGEITCSNEKVFEEEETENDTVRLCFVISGK